MKLQDFTGGLNTRKRPQFLAVNQGTVYSNIDNAVGTLAPVKTKLATEINVSKYSYYFRAKDIWLSSDVETDYAEYNSKAYYTDGVQPKYHDGTTEYNLGIDAPATAPTLTAVNNFDVVNDLKITTTVAAGLPVQTEYYLIINASSSAYSNAAYLSVDVAGKVTTINDSSYNPGSPLKVDTSSSTRTITIANPSGAVIQSAGVKVFRLYKGTYYLAGTLATTTSSFTDSTADISANEVLDLAKFGPLQGTYQYQLTYVNSTTGDESAPSALSSELAVQGSISVTGLPVSSDPQVDKKRLYRIGGASTSFTRVVELANTTTSYSDTIKDVDLAGQILDTVGYESAPSGLKYIIESYAMLFAAEGTKLRYTPIDKPASWPTLFFINFAEEITGLVSVSNGILVFTKYRTYIVTGTGPKSLSRQLLRGDQGCIANQSIQDLGSAAIWASTDGVCISNGNDVKVLTKDLLGKIELNPVSSALLDEVYYLAEADSILAIDYRYGLIVKRLELGVETLVSANDKLYGWSAGTLYELFASEIKETMHFTSARFIEGRSSEYKTYKKVYIYSKGDIIINIIISDKIVVTKTLSGEGISELQVPQSLQRGSFIQFDITGTGEVYEIEYQAGRRQDG